MASQSKGLLDIPTPYALDATIIYSYALRAIDSSVQRHMRADMIIQSSHYEQAVLPLPHSPHSQRVAHRKQHW